MEVVGSSPTPTSKRGRTGALFAEESIDKARLLGYKWSGKRDFDMGELKLLVDAVQASKFITSKKSEELIAKLELKRLMKRFEAEADKAAYAEIGTRVHNVRLVQDGKELDEIRSRLTEGCDSSILLLYEPAPAEAEEEKKPKRKNEPGFIKMTSF